MDLKSAIQKILQRHTESLTVEQICNQIAGNSEKRYTGIISLVAIESYPNMVFHKHNKKSVGGLKNG